MFLVGGSRPVRTAPPVKPSDQPFFPPPRSTDGARIKQSGTNRSPAEGRFPGRRPSLTEQQREYIRVERSRGVSQMELAKLLEVSRWTIQQVDG